MGKGLDRDDRLPRAIRAGHGDLKVAQSKQSWRYVIEIACCHQGQCAREAAKERVVASPGSVEILAAAAGVVLLQPPARLIQLQLRTG
jgi:hypothetical protein